MKHILLLSIFIPGILLSQPVEQGVFSFDEGMLTQSTGISLMGDWQFRFRSNDINDYSEPLLVEVPNSWINYQIDGVELPSNGWGVYQLKIKNQDHSKNLALLLFGISVDYRVSIDDQVLFRSKAYLPPKEQEGYPGKSRDVIPLPNFEEITLTIEVTNSIHVDGGLTKAPVIGFAKTLTKSETNRANFEMVQIGCLLLMAVYNLILFFQFRNLAYIYLSILCFIILIRGLIVFDGSLVLYSLFPDMGFGFSKRIEFFFVYSTVFIPPLFIESLFKDFKFRKINMGLTAIGSILMAIAAFTPPHIFTGILNIYHIMMIPSFVVVFAIVFRAIKMKKVGAQIALLGILINFGFTAVEIMINSGIVEIYHGGPNLVNTGTVVFLFVQTIVISRVFANYREENTRKTVELTKAEFEKQTFEKELGDREKKLADYTLNMIQRNKLVDDLEQLITSLKKNKGKETLHSALDKIGRIIGMNKQSNSQWEDFNRYFGNVHQDFFNTLRSQYPDLSTNDLRHCALIKMGLSLKESAEILAVDSGSVKVARYRMKRKMGLGEDDDLRQVITTL